MLKHVKTYILRVLHCEFHKGMAHVKSIHESVVNSQRALNLTYEAYK